MNAKAAAPYRVFIAMPGDSRHDEALAKVDWAMATIPRAARGAYVQPTVEPLQDILNAEVLEADDAARLAELIAALERAAARDRSA